MHVILNFLIGQFAKINFRHIIKAMVLMFIQQANPGNYTMHPAGQRLQHLDCVLGVFRFAEYLVINANDGISRKDYFISH